MPISEEELRRTVEEMRALREADIANAATRPTMTAEDIVKRLAECPGSPLDSGCSLCFGVTKKIPQQDLMVYAIQHSPNCPLVLAREWVQANG